MQSSEKGRLTERQRLAWHLRHNEGLSPEAIAKRLGIALPNVFCLLARARQRMNQTCSPKRRRPHLAPHRRWIRPTSLSLFHEL